MNQYIDVYCERLAPGLLAEPLNALSNLAFFIAALCAWRLAQREHVTGKGFCTLLGLLLMIGVGSTLFHTFATRWAALTDTLPILLFQLAFLVLYVRHVMNRPLYIALMLLGLYIAVIMAVAALPRGILNGGVSYIPALLFVTGLGVYHWYTHKNRRYELLGAAALFAISLTFRTLDRDICDTFPFGVHYIWHMLNGVVLYLCMAAYIGNQEKER